MPMATNAERIELTVGLQDAGQRLDRFLSAPLGSRAKAQSLIDADRVRVDGRHRPKRHVLQVGEVVEVQPAEPPARESASEELAAVRIVYEDPYLLVADKPAGMVVHPARGHASGTLAQALAGRSSGGEDPARAGIVHRLDRDTSGLLVVAKSDAVHRALKALLSSRKLRREYLALVDGHPSARTGTIDAPIGRDRHDRVMMSIDTDHPRAARTHFEVEEVLPEATLLRVTLETGRTHQIRVHLAAIGHPVSGDPLYGTAGRYGLDRQFLHAHRLAFTHPVTGEELDLRSSLPEDLRDALAQARGMSSQLA
jgi:23S rRNA pseudouridine1911/1915/1917 synthase